MGGSVPVSIVLGLSKDTPPHTHLPCLAVPLVYYEKSQVATVTEHHSCIDLMHVAICGAILVLPDGIRQSA